MKLSQIAFACFRRAYHDALGSPGNALAQRRFDAWAEAASRVLGVRITPCASGAAYPVWVRATATAISLAMVAHYGVDLALHPSKPTVPKPPATAVYTATVLTSGAATWADGVVVTDRMTGQRIRVLPPGSRYASTLKSTT